MAIIINLLYLLGTSRESFISCAVCHIILEMSEKKHTAEQKVKSADNYANRAGSNVNILVLAQIIDTEITTMVHIAVVVAFVIDELKQAIEVVV